MTLVGPSLDILGGQAVQLERLVHRLEGSSDLRIDFLAVNPRLPKPFCHLQRIKYLRTIVTSLSYFLSLVRRIPQTDVVHAYSASYWSYVLAPLPAMLLGRIARKRVILNYHSGEAEDHLGKWHLSRLTMALAHEIVVPSEYLVQVFRRHGYQARAVGNFVDLDRIPYRPRAALGPAFLSNRNLEPLYNVACTLRAFGRIQEAWANATLIVAGDGSQRASLEEQARQMALRGVQFVGALAPERMSELYDRADIYLNASNIDNVPLSLLEAAAAGLPIVSTAAGGIPQVIEHGRTGLLVPRNDAEAMAKGALELLDSPERAKAMAVAGRAAVEAKYSWAAVGGAWRDLYREIADEGRP